YKEFNVEKVMAIDGTGDEECAARNGQVFPVDEAIMEEDHPNGTLDWVPVLGAEAEEEESAHFLAPMTVSPVLDLVLPAGKFSPPPISLHREFTLEAPIVNVTSPDVHVTNDVKTPDVTVMNEVKTPEVRVTNEVKAPAVNVQAPNVTVQAPEPVIN